MTINDKIYVAPILATGQIGKWAVSNVRLPRPFYNTTVTVSGEYLISYAPRYTSREFAGDVWFACILPGGELSEWQSFKTDIPPQLYTGIATDYRRSHVYIPGGRTTPMEDERSLDGRVYFLTLASRSKADAKTDVVKQETRAAAAAEHLSYMQQTNQPGSQQLPGFVSFEQARNVMQLAPRPLVMYFHTTKAVKCQQQAQIIQGMNLAATASRAVFAEIDVQAFPQIGQQHGAYRVPFWVFFDAEGHTVHKQAGILQPDELQQLLQKIIK